MKLSAVVLLACASVTSAGCDTSDKSFDYLSLVLQWPATSGRNISHFTLHGLWPSRQGSRENTYPCNCDTEAFDESKLSTIMTDMNAYWPSFGMQNEQFWTHEWSKHGTCAEQLDVLDSQLAYFSSALNLCKQHALEGIWAKAGITPSDTAPYKASDMMHAIKSALGGVPSLGCKTISGKQFLADVAVCHDKTLKVVDCDTSVVAPDNDPCDYSDPITLSTSSAPSPSPSPGPGPAPGPSNVCVPDHHGPKCSSDADCKKVPGCIRCAHSGYCTSTPKVQLLSTEDQLVQTA